MYEYRLMVLGVGNILLKDEGVGVHAVQALESHEWPEGVVLVDGGTAGIDLLPYLDYAPKIVVIDAIKTDSEPGAIFRVTPEILSEYKEQTLSLHQVGFLEILDLAEMVGNCPQAVIYGVQPKEIDWGLELTEPVQAVMPRLLEMVIDEVEKWLAE